MDKRRLVLLGHLLTPAVKKRDDYYAKLDGIKDY